MEQRELKPEEGQDYLETGGCHCPYEDCQSKQIEAGSFDFEGTHVFQSVTCFECGRTWTDEYVLNNVWAEKNDV